jgi:hypothetical protein
MAQLLANFIVRSPIESDAQSKVHEIGPPHARGLCINKPRYWLFHEGFTSNQLRRSHENKLGTSIMKVYWEVAK